MSEQVKVDVEKMSLVKLNKIKPFQGELKYLPDENYQKLKNEILTLGFSEPITVWNEGSAPYKILNGHQRYTALLRMEKEGYKIPEIPIILVKADSVREAKEKILSLTSQFGVIAERGLQEFAEQADIELAEIAGRFIFPDIDMEELESLAQNATDEAESDAEEPAQPTGDKNQRLKNITMYLTEYEYDSTVEKLESLMQENGASDYTDCILMLIEEAYAKG